MDIKLTNICLDCTVPYLKNFVTKADCTSFQGDILIVLYLTNTTNQSCFHIQKFYT